MQHAPHRAVTPVGGQGTKRRFGGRPHAQQQRRPRGPPLPDQHASRASYSLAADFRAAALSVRSQVNSGSVRPKWPNAAVFFEIRTAQIEFFHDAARRELEGCAHQVGDLLFRNATRAFGVHHDRHRIGDADGVRQLHEGAIGDTGCHHVLGDIARHVAGRAVDLRWITY